MFVECVACGVDGRTHYFVHVVIAIIGQASSEYDVWFGLCQLSVVCGQGFVFCVVYRIVGFFGRVPLLRVFVGDDGFGLLTAHKMLVFDDACVWHFGCGVVDYGVTLKIGGVEHFGLECQTAIGEMPETIVEVGVEHTGIDYGVCRLRQLAVF